MANLKLQIFSFDLILFESNQVGRIIFTSFGTLVFCFLCVFFLLFLYVLFLLLFRSLFFLFCSCFFKKREECSSVGAIWAVCSSVFLIVQFAVLKNQLKLFLVCMAGGSSFTASRNCSHHLGRCLIRDAVLWVTLHLAIAAAAEIFF